MWATDLPARAPRLAELCAQDGFDCSVLSYQLGAQAQYHFGASEVYNPWVGYGLGYELVEQSSARTSTRRRRRARVSRS